MSCFDRCREVEPELIGRLLHAARSGRLGHAFLVHSDLPEVREEFALALAQLAACPNRRPDGSPCGSCPVCSHLENNTAPELHHLSPVGKKYQIQVGDRENPEPNSVRYFEQQFYLTEVSGAAAKVGIIHEADRMNVEAQNALLKTLEEPPRETLLVLTTGNPGALLPTTRSRCQPLVILRNFRKFRFAGAERLGPTLAKLCFGAERDLAAAEAGARGLIEVASALKATAETRIEQEWQPRLAAAAQVDEALVKRLDRQREAAAAGAYIRDRNDFLCLVHSFIGQLLVLAQGGRRELLPNPELLDGVELPARIDPEAALRWQREADDLLYHMRFNVNEGLALRTFAVNLVMG